MLLFTEPQRCSLHSFRWLPPGRQGGPQCPGSSAVPPASGLAPPGCCALLGFSDGIELSRHAGLRAGRHGSPFSPLGGSAALSSLLRPSRLGRSSPQGARAPPRPPGASRRCRAPRAGPADAIAARPGGAARRGHGALLHQQVPRGRAAAGAGAGGRSLRGPVRSVSGTAGRRSRGPRRRSGPGCCWSGCGSRPGAGS